VQVSAVAERELELVEYLRVSVDDSGRERSNDEQHDDNATGAGRIGAKVSSSIYSDVGSASRYATKVRGGFDRLVADLRSGRFTADGIVLWESSRGSRKVSEWCELLELLEELGKIVVVTTHGPRLYNPANDRDWRSLIEDAVDAEYESRKTSKRVGRSMAASAHAGKVPGGRRAFGYTRSGLELEPIEAGIVRECARRVLASESIRSIAADLNRRGVRTPGTKAEPAGNAWHPGALAKMLAGPRIAGLRTHKGRVVAVGEWPAIVDEITHKRLAAMLAVTPRSGARGRSPWKATGLLRCELCGENLVGNTDTGGTRRYVCRKAPGYSGCGRLTIKAEPLELELGRAITVRLSDAEARRNADVGDDDAELDELNRLAVLSAEAAEDRLSGVLSREAHAELVAGLERRRADVEARLSAKVHRTNALALVAVEELVGRPWEEIPVDEARTYLGALIESVTVGPATLRGSTRFEAARILAPGRIAWRPLAA
jgi:DNA invertase Pin-like site-specific DNA recombinase